MPKILCLHGYGANATIFRSQTAIFRSKLNDSYVFDFVDAPFPSDAAPGISALFETSGTYTWWKHSEPQSIRESHRWVSDYAWQNGPYDAICCFSQGCSLAASMALYHSMKNQSAVDIQAKGHKEEPLPFRAAIFICGGISFVALDEMGLEVSQRAHDINQHTGKLLNEAAGKLDDLKADPNLVTPGVSLWDLGRGLLLHNPNIRPARHDVFGLDFTAFPASACITIPTVHIYGAKDPRWPAAMQLAEFCKDRMEYDHGGGHDIPRSTAVSDKIAAMIEDLMSRVHSRSRPDDSR